MNHRRAIDRLENELPQADPVTARPSWAWTHQYREKPEPDMVRLRVLREMCLRLCPGSPRGPRGANRRRKRPTVKEISK